MISSSATSMPIRNCPGSNLRLDNEDADSAAVAAHYGTFQPRDNAEESHAIPTAEHGEQLTFFNFIFLSCFKGCS